MTLQKQKIVKKKMPQEKPKKQDSDLTPGLAKNKSDRLLKKANSANPSISEHKPVLLQEVLKYLDPKQGESFLDVTAGYGGHSTEVLAKTLAPTRATLIDRDQNAIDFLTSKFEGQETEIIKSDFSTESNKLAKEGRLYDIILADLGVSSPHLDKASRGFSLSADGPLDMRMDQSQDLTAEEVVNNYSAEDLQKIIREYGDEPKAKRIAKLIVENRPISTTTELAKVVARAWSGSTAGRSRRHPAVRTFQAIRIAVNDEIGQLKTALDSWFAMLSPGGRIAIISFHSLEDRAVKRAIKELSGNRYDAVLSDIAKGTVTASDDELVFNPRARSAKLRAAAKINTKNGRG